MWDLASGDKKQTLEGHTDYIHAVTLLQKDNQIVSAGEDGLVKFWDPRCGDSSSANTGQIEPNKLEMARRSTVGAWVSCLDISPSEDWLVSIIIFECYKYSVSFFRCRNNLKEVFNRYIQYLIGFIYSFFVYYCFL